MQDFLTLALATIALFSTVYLIAGFASIVSSHTATPIHPTPELPTQDDVDAVIEALTIAAAPIAFIPETPAASPSTSQSPETNAPDWSAIAHAQLRKECSTRAIKWRNFHGKNHHMKKREMVAALEA